MAPLVFDMGTGARGLGMSLLGSPGRELDLLFSHFHMDHVFGFPFFVPIYVPGYKVRITVPGYSVEEAREKLSRYLNGMFHPTRLRDLPSEVSFSVVRPGAPFERGGYLLEGLQLNHPGGAMGYTVQADGVKLAYITDTAPFARPGEGLLAGEGPTPREEALVRFLSGCDTVIFDTMYEQAAYLERMTWGHSFPEYAVAVAQAAGVHELVLFHHAPEADDDQLDARADYWRGHTAPRVIVAREGATMTVEG
ncbi:MAG: hypothetical protein JXX28_00935 [Deltaproteobacteria bacterium]|nr:hypothetical protein [Deltaproteobacteria bacterium]